MRLQIYLTEKSYTQSDVPRNYFWVVFGLERAAQQLKSYKMDGVSGISGSKEIIMSFLGIARDSVLIMPSKETEQLNKLSRIMYDNPLYLLQDNMKALFRIWDKGSRSMDGVIFNIFEYVLDYWKKNSKYKDVAYDGEYFGFYQRLSYMADTIKKVNGPRDLAKWAKWAIEEMYKREKGETFNVSRYLESFRELSLKDWEESIIEAMKKVAEVYGDEGEWIVKNRTLKIPKNSTLVVLKSPMGSWNYSFMDFLEDIAKGVIKVPEGMKDSDYYHQYREENSPQVNIVKEHGLDKLYKVRYVNTKDFEKIKSGYYSRRYK